MYKDSLVPLLALSGCGYHLRGELDLPEGVRTVRLDAVPGSLQEAARFVLEASGVDVVSGKDPHDLLLRMREQGFTERVLTVDPDTGKAREYELSYGLTYTVLDSRGKPVVPPRTITLVRDYVFDRDAVIGKSRERGVLQREMRQDAVLQALRALEGLRKK